VVRTRVGYSGGSTPSPTYRNIGDHSEALQVDYDPSRISYRELLDIFWRAHDPGIRSWSRQYRVVIFYHNEEQKRLALASIDREASKRKDIYTEISPFSGFTLAEDYHQKYRLQQESDLSAEFDAVYPSMKDFLNSTAIARVNGFLGGYGSPELLAKEIDSYGLSASSKKRLIDLLSSTRPVFRSCPL